MIPTRLPVRANVTARFAVSDDFPTPPLPEEMPMTRVPLPGDASAISRAAAFGPRRRDDSAAASSSVMATNATLTASAPPALAAAASTAARTEAEAADPGLGTATNTVTTPFVASTSLTNPRSPRVRLISGSTTASMAVRMLSTWLKVQSP